MSAVFSFLRILNDPDEIKNISDEEMKEIVKDVNFNIIKVLEDSRHCKLLRENDGELIDKVLNTANDKRNIELIVDSLKIQFLMGKELYKLTKSIVTSIDDKESIVKFLIQILKDADNNNLRKFLYILKTKNENKLLNELIKTAELILDTKDIKDKFSRNLNTIIEECKTHD